MGATAGMRPQEGVRAAKIGVYGVLRAQGSHPSRPSLPTNPTGQATTRAPAPPRPRALGFPPPSPGQVAVSVLFGG